MPRIGQICGTFSQALHLTLLLSNLKWNAVGCKLHRDARDEVTTTVATNVTHAAAHSVAWATTVVDATTTEAIVKFGCGDLGIGVCIALRA